MGLVTPGASYQILEKWVNIFPYKKGKQKEEKRHGEREGSDQNVILVDL